MTLSASSKWESAQLSVSDLVVFSEVGSRVKLEVAVGAVTAHRIVRLRLQHHAFRLSSVHLRDTTHTAHNTMTMRCSCVCTYTRTCNTRIMRSVTSLSLRDVTHSRPWALDSPSLHDVTADLGPSTHRRLMTSQESLGTVLTVA